MKTTILKVFLCLLIAWIGCSEPLSESLVSTEGQLPNTWTNITPDTTSKYSCVYFISKDEGWIGGQTRYVGGDTGEGNRAAVYHTIDGGSTWSKAVILTETNLFGICFFDKLNGISIRRNVFKSGNGGTSWNEVLKLGGPIVRDIDFTDASTGWASASSLSTGGMVMRSIDGGNTWEIIEASIRKENDDGIFSSISVPSLSVIYAAGTVATYCGILVKSSDGGVTWEDVYSSWGTRFWSVHFVNDSLGWVGGEYRTIYRTCDGGSSWILQDTPQSSDAIVDIHSIDQYKAIAVTSAGAVLATDNGGESWEEQVPSDDQNTLIRVFFHSSGNAWAVGSRIVLKGCYIHP
ncbi:WD40/YVTN/BNR-like repeat-containing protein [candidate division KSB1 bacterium]